MNRINCSCGCQGGCNSCEFNPCAVTCSGSVELFGDYAYIYNTTAQTISEDAAVTFSANGALSGTITHTAGTAEIAIGRTGVYLVNYVLTGDDDETQLTMYSNGNPIAGTTYTAADGNVYGQFIVPIQAGDVLTLVNTGSDCITLSTTCSRETDPTNAAVTIVRVF
ncbi:MAG: hypothetical protein J1E96_07755 [Ruminococcus sp.]|nr:hypothetical protein [Ruminococcus sp.]